MLVSHRGLPLMLALTAFVTGCAAPLDKPLSDALTPTVRVNAQISDLRAESWKKTQVVQSSVGVVQHLGDDQFPGGSIPSYIAQELAEVLNERNVKSFVLKTADIRLSIPGAKLDQAQVAMAVAMTGLIAAPVLGLLSSLERNKSASAVLCVSVDGHSFLGNNALLFAYGAEGELKAALSGALATLKQNISAGKPTTSPACEPGWEGGQPR